MPGQSRVWQILVIPHSDTVDVGITLRATADCSAADAVCTGNGRALSVPVSATVPRQPPGLSVADAIAEEGANPSMDFAVTLSRALADPVTVDYATSDGTAAAGLDYTATSGKLTFAAGETGKTVSVPLLDDDLEEGGEMFTLTLSRASGGRAYLSDSTATGAIADDDRIAPPVEGPQGIVLVSNLDQPLHQRPEVGRKAGEGSKSYNQRGAQAFTTGNAADGYKLTAVVLNLLDYEARDGKNLEVSLHLLNVTGQPLGTKILDFENPATYSRWNGDGGPMTFVPADGTSEESRILLPDTDYVIQFRLYNPSTVRWFTIDATDSGSDTGTDGWTIADHSHWKRVNSDWGTMDLAMKMNIMGTRVEDSLAFDPGLPVTLSVAENTPTGTAIGEPFTASRSDGKRRIDLLSGRPRQRRFRD